MTSFVITNGTVVTEDGSLSAQFEHTLIVTRHGCEVLTASDAGAHVAQET